MGGGPAGIGLGWIARRDYITLYWAPVLLKGKKKNENVSAMTLLEIPFRANDDAYLEPRGWKTVFQDLLLEKNEKIKSSILPENISDPKHLASMH